MLYKHLLNLPALASIGSRKTQRKMGENQNKTMKKADPLLIAASSFQTVVPFPSA